MELYKECQRNHAAALGKFATDGCNEFISDRQRGPTGLFCHSCDCHRNFHRKVLVQDKDADFGASGAEEKNKRKSDDGTITIEILSGTATKERYREEAETCEDLDVYSFRVHNLIARGKLNMKLEKEIPAADSKVDPAIDERKESPEKKEGDSREESASGPRKNDPGETSNSKKPEDAQK